MSLASDIVDLLSLLNETQVQESAIMSYFTLTIFSWSLFQFSLNLVVTRGRSFQSVAVDDLDGTGGDANAGGANDEYMEDDQYDGGRTLIEKLNQYAQNSKPSSPKSKKFLCFSSHMFRFDLFHSDLKPDNIICNVSKTVQGHSLYKILLIDFGATCTNWEDLTQLTKLYFVDIDTRVFN